MVKLKSILNDKIIIQSNDLNKEKIIKKIRQQYKNYEF